MNLTERQETLLSFVKQHHEGQKRKYTFEPYWTHVYSVAEIVSKYEPEGIEIALCHDLIEDTECTNDELFDFLMSLGYGHERSCFIDDGVRALTDHYTKEAYPSHNRKMRKRAEATRLGGIKPIYQSVKYADLIDNTSSIVEHDQSFAKVYLSEKIEILDFMRRGNIRLLIECCFTLQTAMKSLNGF